MILHLLPSICSAKNPLRAAGLSFEPGTYRTRAKFLSKAAAGLTILIVQCNACHIDFYDAAGAFTLFSV